MQFLLLFIFLFSLIDAEAQDLDNLLHLYQSESELSTKTKDENAGSLLIYTRDDLERMQVETLQDILKSTRFFRYFENRLAEPDLLNADPMAYSSQSIKIYLNDTELFLPAFGTGLVLFGNIDMDFIDHVEIYEGFPSFEYAIDPALLIIKLYTKTPQRDAGSRVKFLMASHNSNKENVYTSDITENDLAYFVYANHSDNLQDTYTLQDETLKRDTHTNHFYASLEKNAYKLEFNALKKRQNIFLGKFPYAVPKTATRDHSYINATLSHTLLEDKSLSFMLSYMAHSGTSKSLYSTPVPYVNASQIEQSGFGNALTFITKKAFSFAKHTFSTGVQYRHKYFRFDNVKHDGVQGSAGQKYDREDIYSLFLEDAYHLTQNDLLCLSVMGQYYTRNNGMKSESPLQLRLSYIKSLHKLTAKTFLSRQELIPEPYTTASEYIGNPDIKKETIRSAIQEFHYHTKQIVSKLILAYTQLDGFVVADNTGILHNSQKATKTYAASLELSYHFRKKDKFDVRAESLRLTGTDANTDATHINYLFRMLNSVAKFDIFNELIINTGYQNTHNGYDYSAGIKYAYNPDLHISFKGENIFNRGIKRKYLYAIPPSSKYISVPVVEQKFMLSLEYLF
jgi:iron complex outermembrane receptor protein